MTSRRRRFGSLALCVAGLLTLPIRNSAAGAAEPPQFGTEVSVVSLPVFVTDGRGKATPGLTVEDFEVRDERKVVKVVKVVGFRSRVCLLAFDGGVHYDQGAAFEIKPQLLDSAGAPVSVGRFLLAKAVAETDGFRRFVLTFTPTAVPPGDYTLRVRLRDPASGRLSEAYQAVRFLPTP